LVTETAPGTFLKVNGPDADAEDRHDEGGGMIEVQADPADIALVTELWKMGVPWGQIVEDTGHDEVFVAAVIADAGDRKFGIPRVLRQWTSLDTDPTNLGVA
jgi:hypothetical protein